MRRITLTACAIAGLSFTASAYAKAPSRQHLREYAHAYHAVASKLGARAPGRNIARWGMRSGRTASDGDLARSLTVLYRMLHPAPVAYAAPVAAPTTTPTATAYTGGGSSASLSDVPGVPASFAACVAMRESTDGAGSSNIYGILGSGGQGSLAEQKQAFSRMYASRGTQPWAPYDGC